MQTQQLMLGEGALATPINVIQTQLEGVLRGLRASGYSSAKIIVSYRRSAVTPSQIGPHKVVWWPVNSYNMLRSAWKEIQDAKLLFLPFPLTPDYPVVSGLDDLAASDATLASILDNSPSVSRALLETTSLVRRVVPVAWSTRAAGISKSILVIGAIAGGVYYANKRGWIRRAHDYMQSKL